MSNPVSDLKRELIAAAERRHKRARARAGRRLIIAAALAVVAVTASVATALRRDSPGFLEQAQAALTQDAGVLHATWEETMASTDRRCTVTNEIWIDQEPPYRYRAALVRGFPPGSACLGTPTEIGGTFEPLQTLVFEPPSTLRVSQLLFKVPPDPVRVFREAIDRGGAHDEGETELEGRIVRRIRVEPCPDPDCPREASYVYVDPNTFYPVEIRGPAYSDAQKVGDLVSRYRTYEYLPRTEANLALTDIRAQHPEATEP
jgi:hypothetical protein